MIERKKMSGIGGMYPSFEDHQLDKKKIGELFSSNFHEVLYPINYSSRKGPWQFHHPADHRNFIDMSSLTWNGRIKIVNKQNPSTPVINVDGNKDINCSVINNFIHSTVSKITYQLNDFQMGDSAAKSYSYKAYMDNLLSFSKAAKKQSLKYHGFIPDSTTKFDDVAKTRANNSNEGFKQRADLFCTGNYFHFSVKLRIDLANIDKILQPGIQLRFDIERNSDEFSLLSDSTTSDLFEFQIKDTSLEFDKLVPYDSYLRHFESSVGGKKNIYSFDRSQILNFNYPSGITDLSIYSLFHTDKLPSYLIFTLLEDDAYLGDMKRNPFNFQPFDVKEFYLLVNGISYPTQPVKLDINAMDYHHVYVNEFLDKLKLKNSNDSIDISSDDWKNDHFFWIADLNTDKCANYHEHRSNPGTIHLKMQTKSPLSQTTRLLVYSTSRERFSVDYKTGEVTSTLTL